MKLLNLIGRGYGSLYLWGGTATFDQKWTRLIVETNIKCQIINYEFRKKEKGCVRTLTGTVEGIFRVMNTTDYSTGEL
jgi:hypothetical protein